MKKQRLTKGQIQVYIGTGKGKTTAAVGLAVRAAGQGLSVCLVQFLKDASGGELNSLRKLKVRVLNLLKMSSCWESLNKQEKLLLKKEIPKAFSQVSEIIKGGGYDVVILDEINFLLAKHLFKTAEILKILKSKPPTVEVILTGRDAPVSILKIADLVTRMTALKHPFHKGIKARKGIEY